MIAHYTGWGLGDLLDLDMDDVVSWVGAVRPLIERDTGCPLVQGRARI